MHPSAERFFSLQFHTGTETNPAVRAECAAQRLTAARAAVAAGQFVVESESGLLRLFDPAYHKTTFKPMRWMTASDLAEAKRVPTLAVGESVTLAEGFHPRHGVKRKTITRVA